MGIKFVKNTSLNILIANIKHRIGPQVVPTLVRALPLQHTYKSIHKQWRTCFKLAQSIMIRISLFLKLDEGMRSRMSN